MRVRCCHCDRFTYKWTCRCGHRTCTSCKDAPTKTKAERRRERIAKLNLPPSYKPMGNHKCV